jgi:hypothetical protein
LEQLPSSFLSSSSPPQGKAKTEEEEEGSLHFICRLPHPLLDPSGTPKTDPSRVPPLM